MAFGAAILARSKMETLMVTKEETIRSFDDYAENESSLIKLQHFCLFGNWKIIERKKRELMKRIIGNVAATHCVNTNIYVSDVTTTATTKKHTRNTRAL